MGKKFIIDSELLTLMSFLVQGGNGQSCYCTNMIRFLSQICDEIPEENWEDCIIATAFDNIPHSVTANLHKYYFGVASLTPESETLLKQKGFIHGDCSIPAPIQKYIVAQYGWMYAKEGQGKKK